eukprot:926302-Prymnesium_polylepis.2
MVAARPAHLPSRSGGASRATPTRAPRTRCQATRRAPARRAPRVAVPFSCAPHPPFPARFLLAEMCGEVTTTVP